MPFRLSADAALQDVKLGVRSLRKHPIVTAIAIVTLTLGMARAQVFSLCKCVLLRPPVEKYPGSSFAFLFITTGLHFNFGPPGSISLEDYRQYKTADSLAELAAGIRSSCFRRRNPKLVRAVLVCVKSSLCMD